MASANTFISLMPMFKESYAQKAMATHKRPGDNSVSTSPRFQKLKTKIKNYTKK